MLDGDLQQQLTIQKHIETFSCHAVNSGYYMLTKYSKSIACKTICKVADGQLFGNIRNETCYPINEKVNSDT